MTERVTYHHGDLRTALVQTALEIIAERGIEELSVAEAARRTGVSAAAPYRHFANRKMLLAAAAATAADRLAEDFHNDALHSMNRRTKEHTLSSVDTLSCAASTYVRFTVKHRAGFDLIFAAELQGLGDRHLIEAGRSVMDALIPPAMDVTGDARAALRLVERVVSAAHGYATLYLSGFLARRSTDITVFADEAAAIARTLTLSESKRCRR